MTDLTTTNVLIESALDYVQTQEPTFFQYVNRTELERVMQVAFSETIPDTYTLHSETLDFPGILLQFMQALQESDAWRDTSQTAVGQTVLRNIAAGLSHLEFALVRATQNAFMMPGSSREVIYSAMKYLGVSIRRKIPAKIKVQLSIPDHVDPFTIPAFTQFTIDSVPFFNRLDIVFPEFNTYLLVEFVQGQIFTMEGEAAGNAYETLEIGYENYSISNDDVYVRVNGTLWSKATTLKPWDLNKKDKIFFAATEETGNVKIRFGNDVYGKKLTEADALQIIWAETLGDQTPAISTDTSFVYRSLSLDITGTILSGVYGFDDELPLEHYQNLGPYIRSSNEQAVTRPSYTTVALQYPKIRDAIFRGQAEIAPNKRNWMNVVEATLLTAEGGVVTDLNWTDFLTFMEKQSIWQLEIQRKDPVIISVDIYAKVHCVENSDLTVIKPKLVKSIKDFNIVKQGSLGYSLYASDISTLLEGDKLDDITKEQISYVSDIDLSYAANFNSLTIDPAYGIQTNGDILADHLHYIKINTITLETVYTTRRTLQRRDIPAGLVE